MWKSLRVDFASNQLEEKCILADVRPSSMNGLRLTRQHSQPTVTTKHKKLVHETT